MEDAPLFEDPPCLTSEIPAIHRGEAKFEPAGAVQTVVRHAHGYEPLRDLSLALGLDPRELASSISGFGDFVRENRAMIRAQDLTRAAGVFLGNVLVAVRDDAFWIRYGEQFPSAGNARQHYEVLDLLDLLMDADEPTYRACIGMVEEWVRS